MVNPIARLAVNIVAGAATRQLASRVSGAQLGPLGSAAAAALPFVLGRVSPLGLAAVTVGAWAVGRLARAPVPPVAAAPQPEPEAPPPATRPRIKASMPIAWSGAPDY